MSTRSKLIYLVSLNAILASALVALAVVLLHDGDDERELMAGCGAQDESLERFVPVNDSFDSVDEAEAFICHEIAYPRQAPGWMIENISASRSGPAALVGRGVGFASVTLDYMLLNRPGADLRVEVSPFRIDDVTYGIIDHVDIMDSEAKLIQGLDDNHFILQWQANGYSFYVEAHLADGFDLHDLFTVLNSIR